MAEKWRQKDNSPFPPTAGTSALIFLNEELALGVRERPDQLVVALVAFGGVFGQRNGNGFAGRLRNARVRLVRRRQCRMYVRENNSFNSLGLKRHMAGQGVIERPPKAVHI